MNCYYNISIIFRIIKKKHLGRYDTDGAGSAAIFTEVVMGLWLKLLLRTLCQAPFLRKL